MLYEITYTNGTTEEIEADTFKIQDGVYIFSASIEAPDPDDPSSSYLRNVPLLAIPGLGTGLDNSKDVASVEAITYEDAEA